MGGLTEGRPAIDWQGRPYDPANGPAAHPNSRFTVDARQNPAYSKLADAPSGVPLSAIVFGGRRRALAPLVYQTRNWLHGVLVGAGLASETTAAATGAVAAMQELGVSVGTGIFQAMMSVELVNEGPVTILLDSDKTF